MKTKSGREINNSLDFFIAEYIVHDIEPNTSKPSEKIPAAITGITYVLILGFMDILLGHLLITMFGIDKKFEGLCYMSLLLFLGGVINGLAADYYNNVKQKVKRAVASIVKNLAIAFSALAGLYFFDMTFKYDILVDLGFQYWLVFGVIIFILWLAGKFIGKYKNHKKNL